MSKINELSFYILCGSVYYNREGGGIPHPDLWEKVVEKAFINLVYENRRDLKQNCYGVERGRVVRLENGEWILYGTPGCEKFEENLAKEFRLVDYKTDFRTDLHYKTVKSDVEAIESAIKLSRLKDSDKFDFFELT